MRRIFWIHCVGGITIQYHSNLNILKTTLNHSHSYQKHEIEIRESNIAE